eukprot:gene6165-12494_t
MAPTIFPTHNRKFESKTESTFRSNDNNPSQLHGSSENDDGNFESFFEFCEGMESAMDVTRSSSAQMSKQDPKWTGWKCMPSCVSYEGDDTCDSNVEIDSSITTADGKLNTLKPLSHQQQMSYVQINQTNTDHNSNNIPKKVKINDFTTDVFNNNNNNANAMNMSNHSVMSFGTRADAIVLYHNGAGVCNPIGGSLNQSSSRHSRATSTSTRSVAAAATTDNLPTTRPSLLSLHHHHHQSQQQPLHLSPSSSTTIHSFHSNNMNNNISMSRSQQGQGESNFNISNHSNNNNPNMVINTPFSIPVPDILSSQPLSSPMSSLPLTNTSTSTPFPSRADALGFYLHVEKDKDNNNNNNNGNNNGNNNNFNTYENTLPLRGSSVHSTTSLPAGLQRKLQLQHQPHHEVNIDVSSSSMHLNPEKVRSTWNQGIVPLDGHGHGLGHGIDPLNQSVHSEIDGGSSHGPFQGNFSDLLAEYKNKESSKIQHQLQHQRAIVIPSQNSIPIAKGFPVHRPPVGHTGGGGGGSGGGGGGGGNTLTQCVWPTQTQTQTHSLNQSTHSMKSVTFTLPTTTNNNTDDNQEDIDIDSNILQYSQTGLDATSNDGYTPLHYAIQSGSYELVRLFLNIAPYAVTSTSSSGSTPLMIACKSGKLDIVQYLLTEMLVDVNVRDVNGICSLSFAAMEGHLPVIKYLLSSTYENNALNVNIQCNYGYTCLHFACARNDYDIVQYLLEYTNIDVNLRESNGLFAKDLSTSQNIHKLFESLPAGRNGVYGERNHFVTNEVLPLPLFPSSQSLSQSQSTSQPLQHHESMNIFQAIQGGFISPTKSGEINGLVNEIVKMSIHGIQDSEGRTLLHHACSHGQLELTRYLVEVADADTCVLDKYGSTPGTLAASGENTQITEISPKITAKPTSVTPTSKKPDVTSNKSIPTSTNKSITKNRSKYQLQPTPIIDIDKDTGYRNTLLSSSSFAASSVSKDMVLSVPTTSNSIIDSTSTSTPGMIGSDVDLFQLPTLPPQMSMSVSMSSQSQSLSTPLSVPSSFNQIHTDVVSGNNNTTTNQSYDTQQSQHQHQHQLQSTPNKSGA